MNCIETSLSACNYQEDFQASGPRDSPKNETEITDQIENVKGVTYCEAMGHILKNNLPGEIFAMGDAMKNGGLVLGPFLTVAIGIICVHCQHLLLLCSRKMHKKTKMDYYLDYARTVELSFEEGPPKLRQWSKVMRIIANTFLSVSQICFCCVAIVFINENLQQVWSLYEISVNNLLHFLIISVPIILMAMVTTLKVLASYLGNIFLLIPLIIILYFISVDLPSPFERNFVGSWSTLPLFFGTVIYTYAGTGLVLPLQNSMKVHREYYRPTGVLNIGMLIVTCILTALGFLGYLQYGEATKGSISLNLPQDNAFAKATRILLCIATPFSYNLELYVAVQILWPNIRNKITFCNPIIGECVFRASIALITIMVAVNVPKLSLFISLIGGLTSPVLTLIFPPLIDLVVRWEGNKGPGIGLLFKNIAIMLLAILGLFTCSYVSMYQIIQAFLENAR